jgi:hypothetical protein
MRTHEQIIAAAGGYRALAVQLNLSAERVRFWERRKAIPPSQWALVAAARIASLEELAGAASARSAA